MASLLDILAVGVVDDTGEALANGKAYVYQVDSNSFATIYTDAEETEPASNPVTLDTAGKAEVYIGGAVRVVIEDALGNTIDDIDNFGGGGAQRVVGNTVDTVANGVLPKYSGTSGTTLTPTGIAVDDDDNMSGVNDITTVNDIIAGQDVTVGNDLEVTGEVTISGTGTHSVSEEFAREVFTTLPRSVSGSATLTNFARSASVTFSTSSSSYVDVTNLDVDIVVGGRPVKVECVPDEGSSSSFIICKYDNGGSGTINGEYFYRIIATPTVGSPTTIATNIFGRSFINFGSVTTKTFWSGEPVNTISGYGFLSAGTYNIKVQVRSAQSEELLIEDIRLVAYEV